MSGANASPIGRSHQEMKRLWIVPLLLVVVMTASAQQKAGRGSLRNPASLNEKAPAVFSAKFDTSAGVFVVEVHRDWAPNGADRFYNLVKNGFFDNARFFRVIKDFMVQFGINGDPAIQRNWTNANIQDEPVKQGNTRGFITYAKSSQPNSRSTQVFINYKDNSFLNRQGFAPFGKVTSGMEVVDKLYNAYGEMPQQQSERIETQGNAFLTKNFPKLDYIKRATIEK